jgi:hypothetical protein
MTCSCDGAQSRSWPHIIVQSVQNDQNLGAGMRFRSERPVVLAAPCSPTLEFPEIAEAQTLLAALA